MDHSNIEQQDDGCAGSTAAGQCTGRRGFLVRAIGTTGGLALGLTALAAGHADDAPPAAKTGELVLKLSDHEKLKDIGGFEILETDAGRVVVAHTGEETFAACSAVCTHRGGTINYDNDSKQFFCRLHGARFKTDGKVVKGPAKTDLASYASSTAAVVSLSKAGKGATQGGEVME